MLVLLLLCWRGNAWAGDWDTAEQQLATKIAAVTGTVPAAIEITNRSSLGSTDVEVIRKGLLERLSAVGVKFTDPAPEAVNVEISLSENVQEYVWVAEIRKTAGESPAIVMVSRSRAITPANTHEGPSISLRKLLLWSSDSQILDAIVINGSSPRMAVLYSAQIQFYRLQGDRWVEEQGFPITHSRPWPRELRGRLILRNDHSLEAHLPGVICLSNTTSSLSVSCREGADPWPIGTSQSPLNATFSSTRNFFTGALSSGIDRLAPAFYSAAPIQNDRGVSWLLAGVDGNVHLLDGTNDMVLNKLNWGSDIATVHSSCGARWQILSTASGAGQDDAVRAYEMLGREPIAVGPALNFPGGITSLWTAPDDNGAVAVTRNAETGKYEAHLLTMACGQ
ncbi:MAG TPA: hypothetical protein VLK33_03460 [Terriglobales bacterium]|nr:hypothetical protein [Terriglobales bacterium]